MIPSCTTGESLADRAKAIISCIFTVTYLPTYANSNSTRPFWRCILYCEEVQMKLDFCGIDFETACLARASACSVGLVRVRGGEVTDTLYSLINPPNWMNFYSNFTDIHGLTRKDV